ncbi:MAG: SDR family oxidoreductase [Anaerolineae bacterium]|nr:SDR family oxidoreductase [Anaerolineae bacterium]
MNSPKNPYDLTGRRYLVTGASSGIGAAIALALSRQGAAVIGVGRNAGRLEQTRAGLAGQGHSMQVRDLSDVDSLPAWLEAVCAESGPLNGLVHAAGAQSALPVKLLTPARMKPLQTVNVDAALALVRAFIGPKVYAGEDGAIVLLSSVMGQVGAPARVGYSLTKGALEGMARSLALELAPRRIRVNCVAPAFVNSPMLDEMSRTWDDAQRARVEQMHPLGFGEPEDVANAVAFLLAPSGRWITGSTLVVDGGYTAQ